MKKNFIFLSINLLALAIIIGCTKEKADHGLPTAEFVVDSGYIYSDTLLPSGDTAIIALKCRWNGANLIKTVKVLLNNNQVGAPYSIVDSTGKEFIYYCKITKSLSAVEEWSFEVIDNKEHTAYASLNVYNDKSGGEINKINAIIGAQKNPSIGSLYDFTNEINVLKEDVTTEDKQKLIDIVGGYNSDENSFISSPGSSNLSGVYDFSSWTNKNLTQFCATTLTKSQFELINSDKMLISSFHPDKSTDIIEAFQPNQIYSFKTHSGKYGLMIFLSGAISENGFITFDAKIQK